MVFGGFECVLRVELRWPRVSHRRTDKLPKRQRCYGSIVAEERLDSTY
jgi:hypothetical protein